MSEGYIVKVDKVAHFGAEELIAWVDTYCHDYNDGTDLHQLFADRLHMSRISAKTLAHRIAFSAGVGLRNLGHC